MNKPLTTQPKIAPFPAIYASGTPPQPSIHALRPEKPSLFLGPFQPWTSCLTTRPDGLRHLGEMFLPIDDHMPVYRTVGMLMGTWDPGRHPMIVVWRKPPMQPGAVASAPPIAPPAPAVQPAGEPIRPGEPRSAGLLRNGNRQGNPNAAPRCGARTRRGCPCRGPAMKNGRCRMHGGGSTGAKTAEGKARIVAARTIHGRYSAESRAFQARLSALTRRARVLCAFVAADLSLEAVAPLIRQARASELPARRTGGRRPAPRPNTSCDQEQGEAVCGLMAMDLSARQATLLKKLIRDAAQTASAAGIQPIQPGAAPRAAAA